MVKDRGHGRQTVGLRGIGSKRAGRRKGMDREGEGEIYVCLFLPVASAALMGATGRLQGNLGFSCFDIIKIDTSLQTPDQLYG